MIRTQPQSQKAKLHALLQIRPRCGQELVAAGIGYRYSARVYDLREDGFTISDRACVKHEHRAAMVEYVLEGWDDRQGEFPL
jgi:hypothetical protein